MIKNIPITCETKKYIPLSKLSEFQGNLAELSASNFNKLKSSLLKHGITFAFSVWQNNNKNYLLDGHARKKTLDLLVADGYSVDAVPVVVVSAKNIKEAKTKLLIGRSEYHKTVEQGLYEFLSKAQINIEDVENEIELLDMDKFKAEFFEEANMSIDDKSKSKNNICPKCGFNF